MNKENITLNFRFKHFFTRHTWLKIVSLALAIMIWFYVHGKIK
jgi:hypothetical protein